MVGGVVAMAAGGGGRGGGGALAERLGAHFRDWTVLSSTGVSEGAQGVSCTWHRCVLGVSLVHLFSLLLLYCYHYFAITTLFNLSA